MQKGNQKAVDRQCKRELEEGGLTMLKGNQKKVDRQRKKVIRRQCTDNAKR